METALTHLTSAHQIITAAIQAIGQVSGSANSTSPGTTNAPTPTAPVPATGGQTSPGSSGAPTDTLPTNTTSSGIDTTWQENTIAEGGSQSDDEGIDRVSVYEYDLGQYGDSVTSVDLSAVPGDAQLNLVGWDAHGNAIVSIGDDGIIITVEASAAAYLAELTYGAEIGPLSLDVEAMIGARADASADFKINPMEGDFEVELQGGVVVGATVNANGELDLKYMSVEAGATGVAGFAAEGHIEVGFDDWEFEFDAGGKLAFLLGGGADISFAVDGEQIVMDTVHAGQVVWDTGGNVVGVVWEGGGDVLNTLDDWIPGDGVPGIPGI